MFLRWLSSSFSLFSLSLSLSHTHNTHRHTHTLSFLVLHAYHVRRSNKTQRTRLYRDGLSLARADYDATTATYSSGSFVNHLRIFARARARARRLASTQFHVNVPGAHSGRSTNQIPHDDVELCAWMSSLTRRWATRAPTRTYRSSTYSSTKVRLRLGR